MKRHFVHVYHTFRSKFAVDAESHEQAIEKARGLFPKAPHLVSGVMGMVTPAMDVSIHGQVGEGFLCASDAEEIVGFMVDEHLDEDHVATTCHDGAGRITNADAKSVSLTSLERATIFAALRHLQRSEGDNAEGLDKLTCDGEAGGIDAAVLESLCERFIK